MLKRRQRRSGIIDLRRIEKTIEIRQRQQLMIGDHMAISTVC